MKNCLNAMIAAALAAAFAQCAAGGEDAKPLVNDPMFDRQKALFEKLEVARAWELTRGSPEVLVGVIDMGFDFFHPDLKNRMQPGYYAPGGYHTEIIEISAHGTLVASLIAAEADNGAGMTGFAPGCRLLTASLGLLDHLLLRLQKKFMAENPDAGAAGWQKYMAEHLKEIQAFGRRHTHHVAVGTAESIRYLVDRGARVVNMSIYLDKAVISAEADRALLDEAFRYAKDKDVVLLVGSGNNARETSDYPGDESYCLVVGASLLDDTRWEEEVDYMGRKLKQGSNFGKRLSVMAPIDDLVVAFPHDRRFYSSEDGPMGATKTDFEGICRVERRGATSSATPIVAALAALVRSLRPDLKAPQVVDLIKKSCDDLGEPGFDKFTGWGRVNFRKTLELAKAQEK